MFWWLFTNKDTFWCLAYGIWISFKYVSQVFACIYIDFSLYIAFILLLIFFVFVKFWLCIVGPHQPFGCQTLLTYLSNKVFITLPKHSSLIPFKLNILRSEKQSVLLYLPTQIRFPIGGNRVTCRVSIRANNSQGKHHELSSDRVLKTAVNLWASRRKVNHFFAIFYSFELGGITKHSMTGPAGNRGFCFA